MKKVICFLLLAGILNLCFGYVSAQTSEFNLKKKQEVLINYRLPQSSAHTLPDFAILAKEFKFKNNSNATIKLIPQNLYDEELLQEYLKSNNIKYSDFIYKFDSDDAYLVIFASLLCPPMLIVLPVYFLAEGTTCVVSRVIAGPRYFYKKHKHKKDFLKYTKSVTDIEIKPKKTIRFYTIQQYKQIAPAVEFEVVDINTGNTYKIYEPQEGVKRKKITKKILKLID